MSENIQHIVEDYYKNSYAKIHGESMLSIADKMFHKQLESSHNKNSHFENVLELGSGNYEHIPYVRHSYITYTCVDLREPTRPHPEDSRVAFVKADATSLPFPDESFDRIISTCLLMHLPDPISALAEWKRLLKPGGVLEIMAPCEPGTALTLFQRLFSEPNAAKRGVPAKTYRLINAYDHLSSFPRLNSLVEAFTAGLATVKYYPFNWLRNYNFNAFAIFRYVKSE